MIKPSAWSIILLFSVLFLTGCDGGLSVTGRVENAVSRTPASGVIVTALTSVDTIEDKRYEKIATIADSAGKFTLNGLSTRYRYTIRAGGDDMSSETRIEPLEANMTRVLGEPVKICPRPAGEGVFAWENGGWKRMDENATFTVRPSAAQGYITGETPVDCYLPLKSEVPFHRLSGPVVLTFSSEKFRYHQISPLYYHPGDQPPGGYHWGIRNFKHRNAGGRLKVDRVLSHEPVSGFCRERVGDVAFARLDLDQNAYYGILPSGSLDLREADLRDAVKKGIRGIVFRVSP